MGWSFYSDPRYGKDRVIKDLVESSGLTWDGQKCEVIGHAVVGGKLWRVVERQDGARDFALDLVKSGGRNSGWGNKDVPHREHLDIPLRLLGMVPADLTSQADTEWRKAIHEHRAAQAAEKLKRAALAPGASITVYGKPYEVIRKHRKRGWIIKNPAGQIFRAISGIVVNPVVPA